MYVRNMPRTCEATTCQRAPIVGANGLWYCYEHFLTALRQIQYQVGELDRALGSGSGEANVT